MDGVGRVILDGAWWLQDIGVIFGNHQCLQRLAALPFTAPYPLTGAVLGWILGQQPSTDLTEAQQLHDLLLLLGSCENRNSLHCLFPMRGVGHLCATEPTDEAMAQPRALAQSGVWVGKEWR